ncbi:MAG: hypothetical protein B5M49_03185 [Thermotoga sp. 4484_232]|nr:MAG: hypothetical protein B5M49_03185 [Thermotoga sp. 4484_232]
MPFDGLMMKKVTDEMKKVVGQFLKQIYQPTSVDYFFLFQNHTLRISLNPSMSHLSIVEKEKFGSKMPSSFTMFLRKKLKGARLEEIEQRGLDRVAIFRFHKMDEIGKEHDYELIVEIMGKFSNMLLVENGKILDVHRRISTRKRELLPGREYVPYPSGKINILEEDIETILKELEDIPIDKFLLKKLEGFSNFSISELLARAGVDFTFSASNMTQPRFEKIKKAVESLKKDYFMVGAFVYFRNEHPCEITPFPSLILSHLAEKHFSSPSEAINLFYKWKEGKSAFEQKKKELEKIVVTRIEEFENLKGKLLKELKESEDFEKYKKMGDLMIYSLHEIKDKKGEAVLVDWETGEKIRVVLDKDPSKKAQDYFERYKKLKRKYERLKSRVPEIERELEYLYQLWQTIVDSEDEETLREIEDEMISEGIIKVKRKRKGTIGYKPRETVFKGFKILIGKNNRQNDSLVRNASDDDLWFHAREMPGAHVVLKVEGKTPDEEVIEYAAALAAGYSRGKLSGNVPVDYTKIKYVSKPKGAKPGLVVYRNHKTLVVKPRRLEENTGYGGL